MRLKRRLMSPAGSDGTPSGGSGGGGEQRLPAGSAIPQERNDGKVEDSPSDGQPDWGAEAEGVSDGDDGGFEELSGKDTQSGGGQDTQQGGGQDTQTPQDTQQGGQDTQAAQDTQSGADTQPGAQGKDTQSGAQDTQAGGEQQAQAETPEQKQAREAREAQERQQFEQELEEYYKIPDDLAARLATEPEVVMPKLAAKVHQAVLAGMQNYIAQQVPRMFQQLSRVQEANQRSMNAFYDRWPGLKQHEKQVLEVGKMYRQMNPKASSKDSIERIGQLVCAAMGFDATKFGKVQGNGQGGQPPARRSGQPPRPSGVGASQAGDQRPQANPWSEEAESMLEEDRQ